MAAETSEALARATALEVARRILDRTPDLLAADEPKFKQFSQQLARRVWLTYDAIRAIDPKQVRQ